MVFFDWLTARIRCHFATSDSSEEPVDILEGDFVVHLVLDDIVVLDFHVSDARLVFGLDSE